MPDLLSERYRALYQNYYCTDEVAAKRALSALDALANIHAVVGPGPFGRVVDVGAGEGSLLQILNEIEFARELYALEIAQSGVEAIAQRKLQKLVELKGFDGYKIPYRDQYFDLAILSQVLEHVEHERLLLLELRRVATRIVVEVPIEHGLRIERKIASGARYGHINYYLPETVRNLLQSSGLRVVKSKICCPSLAYEKYCAGWGRGLLMAALRRTALKVSRRAAPWLFTYVFVAYCVPEDGKSASAGSRVAAVSPAGRANEAPAVPPIGPDYAVGSPY